MPAKIISALFLGATFTVCAAGGLRTIFNPDKINVYENRYANRIEAFSVENYADESFQNSIESALSDQVFYSNEAKEKYNSFSALISKPVIDRFSIGNSSYVTYKDSLCFFNEHLTYKPVALSDFQSSLEKRAKAINSIAKKFENIDFYVYYVDIDLDMNFETGERVGLSDCLTDNLNIGKKNAQVFKLTNFDDFDNYFYRTDHHWNYKGSYKAYLQIADMLGIKNVIKPEDEISSGKTFAGSRSVSAGLSETYRDEMVIYKFDYPNMDITIDGEKAKDYGSQSELEDGETDEVSYGAVYGWDDGEVIADTKTDGENLLIVGDSYDNAILKLLASGFSKTYCVDLRYYRTNLNKGFDFSDYVKKNNIDKVLLIGDIDYFIDDTFSIGD
jgi:hypothetical protein